MYEFKIESANLKNNKLTAKVSASKEVDKYLWNRELFVKYDADIYADESIQNIPLTSVVLPLAWLTGSDISVKVLDRNYKESIDKLRKIFKKLYPLAPFSTELYVDELVDTNIEAVDSKYKTGLLFSGGVDSTYSLINNLEKKPRLLMHWGVDGYPYPKWSSYWNKVIDTYSKLANSLGISLNVIKTNALDILHTRRIEHDFHRELYDGSLWLRLQFTLLLAPLLAPLSVKRFDRLIVAASHDPNYSDITTWGPTANEPLTDNEIKWADFEVKQDGYLLRHEKIKSKIKNYLIDNERVLRVCNNRQGSGSDLNCSSCEKCYRTIISLIQAGIDPNSCGFKVTDESFKEVKKMFISRELSPQILEYQWTPIINSSNQGEETQYGFNDLFNWLKSHNLNSSEKDVWLFRDLYMNLPWILAKGIDEIYRIFGIKIHEHSPVRKNKGQIQLV